MTGRAGLFCGMLAIVCMNDVFKIVVWADIVCLMEK